MAGLHNPRTHKQRDADSRRFVVQKAVSTFARIVGTSQSRGRQLPHKLEDAVVVCVMSSSIG